MSANKEPKWEDNKKEYVSNDEYDKHKQQRRLSEGDVRSEKQSVGGDVWNYEKINRIGEGTYGVVYRARDKTTGEIVALKKVRMDRERDGMPVTALRELRILQMCHHPNIVNLKKIVTGNRVDSIFLVFEYVEHDVAALLDGMRAPFSQAEVKCLARQVLRAVEFLHRHCILHRDLKLSNLLLNNRGGLKLCDFGLARFCKPASAEMTPQVVTLWYRAPELLLGASSYSCAVDMWALGCILGELLLNEPLFPGKTEIQMLELISRRIGEPNERIWPALSELPLRGDLNTIPSQPYNLLKSQFPQLGPEGLDLLNSMLTYDPTKRITASEALRHPYWTTSPLPKPQEAMPTFPTAHDRLPSSTSHHHHHPLPSGGVGAAAAPPSTSASASAAASSAVGVKRPRPALPQDRMDVGGRADRFGSIFGGSSSGSYLARANEMAKPDIRIKKSRSEK